MVYDRIIILRFERGFKMLNIKSNMIKTLICVLVTLVFAFLNFYITLPAINLQSSDFYGFLFSIAVVYIICAMLVSGVRLQNGIREWFSFIKKQCMVVFILGIIVVIIFGVGKLLSAQFLRASAYRDLLKVTDGNFNDDVDEISVNEIPMLDRDSAERLGDRKLGELSDMVSQFEVSADYSQINYNNRPVRVTPLIYGDVIKWFNNRQSGLPAYIVIDMATQAAEVVRLDDGIKYSKSEHFSRNLMRHIRFNYPTMMFSSPTFEIDEDGHPYWVCPKIVKTIGLFGGTDVSGAVLVDAVTGECEYFEEVPKWVDRVYPADLICEQYNYHGAYINGFINSIFGQKGVTSTTAGYNYIAIDDDVYMYTGITSVGSDQSNIGFILSNQRTKETKFYPIAGATEHSAMASAQGVVQHLNYTATFPLLLNVAGEPTYFMSLKDRANLVKMYAMVNVKQYQVVATGSSYAECEQKYAQLLLQNNITEATPITKDSIDGTISSIKSAVIDSNTYYYIELDGNGIYYEIPVKDNKVVITLNVGDSVLVMGTSSSDGPIRTAYSIEKK